MINKKINIITGGLNKSPRNGSVTNIVNVTKDELNITFYKEDTISLFEKELLKTSKKSQFISNLKKAIASFSVTVLSVLVVFFILISSSIIEKLTNKFIYESSILKQGDYIALAIVLSFMIFLLLFPSLFEKQHSGFKDFISSYFKEENRLVNKFKYILKSYDKNLTVNLYNFDLEKDLNLWNLLVPSIVKRFDNVNFYIRKDKVEEVLRNIERLGILKPNIIEQDIPVHPSIKYIDSQNEENLFNLLQICSTNYVSAKDSEEVSLELFEFCAKNLYGDTKNGSKEAYVQNYIERAFQDFKIIQLQKNNFVKLNFKEDRKNIKDDIKRVTYFLRNHIEQIVQVINTPLALMITYSIISKVETNDQKRVILAKAIIDSIKKNPSNSYINKYWVIIFGEMFDSGDIYNYMRTKNSIYRKLPISYLDDLIAMLRKAGLNKEVMNITRYLFPLNYTRYKRKISTLYERMGEYQKAFENLPTKEEIDLPYTIVPKDKITFYERKAWLIVASRDEKRKKEGYEALEQLKNLMFKTNETINPINLWGYHNIKGNYLEWDQDYEGAVAQHIKALNVPLLSDYDYGSTYVNLSIAYRYLFVKSNATNERYIQKAIKLNEIGKDIKNTQDGDDFYTVIQSNHSLSIVYSQIINKDYELLRKTKEENLKAINYAKKNMVKKGTSMLRIQNEIIDNILINENLSSYNFDRYKKNINKDQIQIIKDFISLYTDKTKG